MSFAGHEADRVRVEEVCRRVTLRLKEKGFDTPVACKPLGNDQGAYATPRTLVDARGRPTVHIVAPGTKNAGAMHWYYSSEVAIWPIG